ncbi:MAG TPA: cysteine--tRNA ligase [Candidatus Saccharimonadales bacterium]
MKMKLYNTLTRQIDEVTPLVPPTITIYTCGPTVYDHTHIGHWYNYVRMDTLIRALKAADLQTKWVMNITDVGHLTSDADEGEDKLEKGAKREGKTAWEVAKIYTDEFIDGMHKLNILTPDFIVKATDHIDEQIAMIKTLIDKGFGYVISDGVYYDTAKFEGYKDFAKLDLDEQQAGARVAFNPEKRNLSDFALWKFSPEGSNRDMEWESPWGKGFPGWHIECSAMSIKYLGETIDIHCGGIDHIPVHHTNEIAQSEAATGKRFANYWMHSNHISVNGEKISKSLGNSITLEDLEQKGYSPEVLRVNILESHYQSQSKFSWDSLEAAKQRLIDLKAMAVLRYQTIDSTADQLDSAAVIQDIKNLLINNLETPAIMAYLSELANRLLKSGLSKADYDSFVSLLGNIDQLLGLKLSQISDIDDAVTDLIARRETERGNKDWQASDDTRKELENDHNVLVLDTPAGPSWRWSF